MKKVVVVLLACGGAMIVTGVVSDTMNWLVVVGLVLFGGTALWGWLHLTAPEPSRPRPALTSPPAGRDSTDGTA